MENLFDEIFVKYLMDSITVVPSDDIPAIIEGRCYQAICEIKDVLNDDRLSDPECFSRIEEIVCIMEHLGPGAGMRHDFG